MIAVSACSPAPAGPTAATASTPAAASPSATIASPFTSGEVKNAPCDTHAVTSVPTPRGPYQLITNVTCYDVTGGTAQQIRANINASPSRPGTAQGVFDSRAKWFYAWAYASAGGSPCAPRGVTLSLRLDYVYPRWMSTAPPPLLVLQWNDYVAALQTHENGHGQRAMDGVPGMLGQIVDTTAPACDQLSAAVKLTFESALARIDQIEADYDIETRHGATQGARFP